MQRDWLQENYYYLLNDVSHKLYFNVMSLSASNNGQGQYYIVAPGGYITKDYVNNAGMIRPSIILNKDVEIKSGDGTKKNPYVLLEK